MGYIVKTDFIKAFVQVVLRVGLLAALGAAGWTIYSHLPQQPASEPQVAHGETVLQIVLRPATTFNAPEIDIPVELYPIDIVSVRDEYFTERRAGKRFDDFLSERMKGRTPVTAKLDKQGQTSILVNPGDWWLHALLGGDEQLEWRLPLKVHGRKQIIELTPANIYTRTRSF